MTALYNSVLILLLFNSGSNVFYCNLKLLIQCRCDRNDKRFPVWLLINSEDTIKKINIRDQDGWIDKYIIAEPVNLQLKC